MNESTDQPVSISSSDSQKIKLVFGHADSGKLVSTVEGTSLPIPETGELVRFGEIDLAKTQGQEASFGGQAYTVVERDYHYFAIDTETVTGREEPAYLATVIVRVLPEDEDNKQQTTTNDRQQVSANNGQQMNRNQNQDQNQSQGKVQSQEQRASNESAVRNQPHRGKEATGQ